MKSLIQRQKRYFKYHVRWQVSAVVSMPFMYLFTWMGLSLWANIVVSQFVLALGFWYIDKYWVFEAKEP